MIKFLGMDTKPSIKLVTFESQQRFLKLWIQPESDRKFTFQANTCISLALYRIWAVIFNTFFFIASI